MVECFSVVWKPKLFVKPIIYKETARASSQNGYGNFRERRLTAMSRMLPTLLVLCAACSAAALRTVRPDTPWPELQMARALKRQPQALGLASTACLLPGHAAYAAEGQLRGGAVVEELARNDPAMQTFEPRGITPEDTIVFILGTVPFLWATIEFWSRIARGDPFGTGADQVIINDTSGNRPKAVRRVLGKDAIIAAYILFAFAGASAVLVGIAGVDVLSVGGAAGAAGGVQQ